MTFVEIRVKGSKKFSLGEDNDEVVKVEIKLPREWEMSETVISRGDWEETRLWGLDNGYTIFNANINDPLLPVTAVNWFDVALWCNARSEQDGLFPAYTVDGELVTGAQDIKEKDNKTDMDRFRVIKEATGYRLPTESQWEYSATEGATLFSEQYLSHQFSNIPCFDPVCPYCSFGIWIPARRGDGGSWKKELEHVKSRDPSPFGLYHMTGNTLEWVFDDYAESAYVKGQDGEDPSFNEGTGRFEKTLKSSAFTQVNPDSRASDRFCCNATFRMKHVSFRVVKPIV